jgi:hypothetical protein
VVCDHFAATFCERAEIRVPGGDSGGVDCVGVANGLKPEIRAIVRGVVVDDVFPPILFVFSAWGKTKASECLFVFQIGVQPYGYGPTRKQKKRKKSARTAAQLARRSNE